MQKRWLSLLSLMFAGCYITPALDRTVTFADGAKEECIAYEDQTSLLNRPVIVACEPSKTTVTTTVVNGNSVAQTAASGVQAAVLAGILGTK
jgi:hypothetical protein